MITKETIERMAREHEGIKKATVNAWFKASSDSWPDEELTNDSIYLDDCTIEEAIEKINIEIADTWDFYSHTRADETWCSENIEDPDLPFKVGVMIEFGDNGELSEAWDKQYDDGLYIE